MAKYFRDHGYIRKNIRYKMVTTSIQEWNPSRKHWQEEEDPKVNFVSCQYSFLMYFSNFFSLTVYKGTVRSYFCVVQSYSYMYTICTYVYIYKYVLYINIYICIYIYICYMLYNVIYVIMLYMSNMILYNVIIYVIQCYIYIYNLDKASEKKRNIFYLK